MRARSETDVAAAVVAWLQEQDWTVYQEVKLGDRVADVVATHGPLIAVVECKAILGIAVLEQAHEWLRHANYVYAAAPSSRNRFLDTVAREFGIGILEVGRTYGDRSVKEADMVTAVTEKRAPALRRSIEPRLREALRDAHRDGSYAAAGVKLGRRYSPFQGTCDELARLARNEPGITLGDAVGRIRHHYRTTATARSSLAQWLRRGKVHGVEGRIVERKLKLFPSPSKGAAA